jgi:hypothetical protein
MKMLLVAVLLAVAATNQPPVELTLKQRIAGTVIPAVHMDQAEPQQVIEWLRAETKKCTPDKTEINFVWQVPATTKLRTVTLNLVKVPLSDVLNYVTQAAGLRYRVERHAVVIHLPEPPPTKKPVPNAKPQ